MFFLLLATGTWAQQTCPQPPALDRVIGKNIFSDQQEVDLGDAMAENLTREFALIDDPGLTARRRELPDLDSAVKPASVPAKTASQ